MTGTLAGGFYAGTFNRKQPPTEKHWPSSTDEKRYYRMRMFMHGCGMENSFDAWLTQCKHYGAEYLED